MSEMQQYQEDELYGIYVQYLEDSSISRDRTIAPLNREEFAKWIARLDDETRNVFIGEFRMGYAAAFNQGEREVEEVIARHSTIQERP